MQKLFYWGLFILIITTSCHNTKSIPSNNTPVINIYYLCTADTVLTLYQVEGQNYSSFSLPKNSQFIVWGDDTGKSSYRKIIYGINTGYIKYKKFKDERVLTENELPNYSYDYTTRTYHYLPHSSYDTIKNYGSSYSPSYKSSGGGPVQVKGYYKKNGTYVAPHTRKAPSRKH